MSCVLIWLNKHNKFLNVNILNYEQYNHKLIIRVKGSTCTYFYYTIYFNIKCYNITDGCCKRLRNSSQPYSG